MEEKDFYILGANTLSIIANGISVPVATASTSTSTGSITTVGGISCALNSFIGGIIESNGIISTAGITGAANCNIAGTLTCTGLQVNNGIIVTNGITGANANFSGSLFCGTLTCTGTSTFKSQLNDTSTTDSSSTTTGAIITAGGIGCAKKMYIGTGIYYPTSGGTPSSLAYYEESVNVSGNWSGPFSPAIAGNLYLTRVGNMVTMYAIGLGPTAANGTGVTSVNFSGTIPSRFLPITFGSTGAEVMAAVQVTNNSVPSFGMAQVASNGVVKVYATANPTSGIWVVAGASDGFAEFGMSWLVI